MKHIGILLLVGTLIAAGAGSAFAERFIDNGDGTITDTETGLMWEKKTGTLADGNHVCPGGPTCADVHDVNNLYHWSHKPDQEHKGISPIGSAFKNFLGALNDGSSSDGTTITGCFANHCDWRLPSITELNTIVNPGSSPTIDPIFGPTATVYWSTTTYAPKGPRYVWIMSFDGTGVGFNFKSLQDWVRAVRTVPLSER